MNCRPTEIVTEPGDLQLQVTRDLTYDGFGNVGTQTVTGAGMAARATTTDWGATGQFPVSITNVLSQATLLGWNYSLGVQASQTDPNGASIAWQHDAFGRLVREARPDGTATTRSYQDCASGGCVNANNRMTVIETDLDAGDLAVADRRFYADSFDRLIASSGEMLSGAYNRTDREYDALGRVARESTPCWWAACAKYWTDFEYDLLGRVTEVARPVSDSDASVQTTYTYHEGLTRRTIDALARQSTQVANVIAGAARSVDDNGHYQTFDVDGFGNVVRVTDSLGTTLLSNTFNKRGMRIAQTDRAAGSWSYTPNALGEIVSQTDAKSQSTVFEYDGLGRLKKRTEAEGVSTWTWGNSASLHNIGRLASMSGPGYSESYLYDGLGRLAHTTIVSDATYHIDYAYNGLGALHTLTYPTSTSGYRLALQYDYQNGALRRVKDANAPTTVFWEANDTDARGSIVSESLGNGIQTIRGFDQVTGRIDYIQSGSGGAIQNLNYVWDTVGNLTERQDVRQGLTENFYYDNLHRLTSTTGPDPISIGYDARGDVASMSGNLSSGADQTITWYSYNLPNTITEPGGGASQFFYAPDRARWKQAASYGSTSEQTVYVGGLVEKVTRGSVTSWKHYISGAAGPVAVYTRTSSGTNAIHYLTKDHLGSVDTVTNGSGAVEVRLSYGAFGGRRNGDTWSGNPTSGDESQIANTTRRGFTAHEMLDNLNLTHMNGRVYDQAIGRFLSADPFIDGPGRTQGWNRYSYVHNRPLSLTDPSGYEARTQIISWINGQVQVPAGGFMEGVTTTASRWRDAGSDYAATLSLYRGDVRSPPPTEINGGGGIIAHVTTTATRIKSGVVVGPLPASTGNEMEEQQTGCPAVPNAPTNADIHANMRAAAARNPVNGGVNPQSASWINPVATLVWFNNQVKYDASWDYKTQGSQYEDFGNFNFGATGIEAGFSEDTLLRAAGYAQRGHPQSPQFPGDPGDPASILFVPGAGTPPYGDDPDDQRMIQLGVQYARNGC